jgi:disulfide bond formation protein DsbB
LRLAFAANLALLAADRPAGAFAAMSLTSPIGTTQRWAALALLLGMAGTVGIALGFEHIGGYIPCMLCLEQRVPYYAGAPLMAVALVAVWLRWPPLVVRLLLLAGALLMTYGLGLAIYHSGVEYHWWAGPASCGAVVAPQGSGNGVLDQLNAVIPPSCDAAAWRDPVLQLSFAGWNVLASALWAVVGYRAALGR